MTQKLDKITINYRHFPIMTQRKVNAITVYTAKTELIIRPKDS